MERAGRVIGKLSLNRKGGCLSPEQLALAAWPVAVGQRLARRTKAVQLVRERLVVEVEDAVWQRQLFTLRGQILKQIEKAVGSPLVAQLEFRVAIPKREPARAETVVPAQDEADAIADSSLRSIYKAARKKASA